MNRIILMLMILLFPISVFAGNVKGHWKDTNNDGVKDTYVNPYNRSNSNNTTIDNYSTKGNSNPYTGKEGTKDNDYDFNKSYKYENPYDTNKSYQKKNKNWYDND